MHEKHLRNILMHGRKWFTAWKLNGKVASTFRIESYTKSIKDYYRYHNAKIILKNETLEEQPSISDIMYDQWISRRRNSRVPNSSSPHGSTGPTNTAQVPQPPSDQRRHRAVTGCGRCGREPASVSENCATFILTPSKDGFFLTSHFCFVFSNCFLASRKLVSQKFCKL